MAKDDYDVIVFKILLYYYGILKRECIFDMDVLEQRIGVKDIDEEYLVDILRTMQEENLIEGLAFTKAWGNAYIMIGGLQTMREMRITPDGIRHLNDNSKMREVKEMLVNVPGAIAELIKLVSL